MSKLVALMGNPNVGKSTVFNELTGMSEHTGNWIGKTIEASNSSFYYKFNTYELVDLPGTYSLDSKSSDELVSSEYLKQNDIDCVVCVVNATQLERSLMLAYQIMEYTSNIVLLVNLYDQAKKKGIVIDFEELSIALGVPVVKSTALSGKGLNNLLDAIDKVSNGKIIVEPKRVKYNTKVSKERLNQTKMGAINLECMNVVARVVTYSNKHNNILTRFDRILMGKATSIIATIILFGLTLFITIYFSNLPSQALKTLLDYCEMSLAKSLLIAGVDSIFVDIFVHGMLKITFWVIAVMLPPMAIFFPLFALMEDFGILPRLAFNLDVMFQKSGACGKQALTTCMGFGCNAVGVTSARIIENKNQGLMAIITNSLTPCNGRFPFLIVIISIFMANNSLGATFVLMSLLIGSYCMTLLCNKILGKTLLKSENVPLIMELPSYRKPQFAKTLKDTFKYKVLLVLLRAIIVAAPMGLVIWVMSNINIDNTSLLLIVANALNPVAKLIGLDGTMLLAFILGFPANEIVMPIALMIYLNSTNMADYSSIIELKQILIENGWTIKTAICACVFSMFHFPCSTTLLTIFRETKSVKWTITSFVVPLIMGICACYIINIVL